MPLSEWKNGITFTEDGHDMLLPTETIVGDSQTRHYVFLRQPITYGPIGSAKIVKGFKFQFWEGGSVVFESDIELTIQVDWLAEYGYGNIGLSFASIRLVKERIKTSVINGVPTADVTIENSATTSGKVLNSTDFEPLYPEQIEELVNPSWTHTYFGGQTSEFGNLILDLNYGLGTDEAIIDGRYELPIYHQTATPDTQVDIVFDGMQAAGRADLYQFRFGSVVEGEGLSATVDMFGVIHTAMKDQPNTIVLRASSPPYVLGDSRAILFNTKSPSVMVDKFRRIWLGLIDVSEEGHHFTEERLSLNGGHTFEKQKHGTIFRTVASMFVECIINDSTGERGAVSFEGNMLSFRRSSDGWAAAVPVFEFDKPVPVAITQSKGVIRIEDGKGVLFESYDIGATWVNESRVVL